MINKVILVGRVGADPEIRTMGEAGVKTAHLRIATSESYTDRSTNERKELTEWHNVTLWRNLADVADKYVRKGSLLYIEGTIHYRKWTGKDGVERQMTDITATEVKMLNKVEVAAPAEPQYQQVQYPTQTPVPTVEAMPMDEIQDLPF